MSDITTSRGPCELSRALQGVFEFIEPDPIEIKGGITVDPVNRNVSGGGRLDVIGVEIGGGGFIYDATDHRMHTFSN